MMPLVCFMLMFLQFWCATSERSLKSFRFQADTLSPESFDYDRVRDRFLLGSGFHGTISELANDGSLTEFLRDAEYAGKAGIAGVKVDSRRNRVIVAVADTVGLRYGGVAAYDLDSGERVYFASLEGVGVAEGEKFRATDIALNFRTGDVYITNSLGNFLWKVTADGTPSVFLKNDTFTTQPVVVDTFKSVGLTGIVHHPSKFLLATQSSSGALFRVGVEDKSVHKVLLKNNHTFPAAAGVALREDGTLVVVSPERLWLVGSASRWTTASVVDTLAVKATTAAAAVRRRATFVLRRSHLDEFEVSEVVFPTEEAESDPVWLVVLVVAAIVVVSLWRFRMGHFYEQYRRKKD